MEYITAKISLDVAMQVLNDPSNKCDGKCNDYTYNDNSEKLDQALKIAHQNGRFINLKQIEICDRYDCTKCGQLTPICEICRGCDICNNCCLCT